MQRFPTVDVVIVMLFEFYTVFTFFVEYFCVKSEYYYDHRRRSLHVLIRTYICYL